MSSNPHPFAQLSPELVIDAVESTGRVSDLRVFALNSYENRVYQIGIEGGEPLIAKFYRPERWSDAQILEEHYFSQQLLDAELPVVAPLRDANGESLFRFGDFRFAFFPRRGGQAPDLDNPDNQLMLGRLLGRMHAIGAIENYQARPALDIKTFGYDSYHFVAEHVLAEQGISGDLLRAYSTLCEDLLKRVETIFAEVKPKLLRTHSDCHVGNILSREQHCFFVDLDDSRMTPAIQDIWMLQSGERHERVAQLAELLEGYNEFYDFDLRELTLIEALRTLRIMHFSAWLARRWKDPAFPLGFPWFGSQRYWADHILELREQLAALNEPPLRIF